jgi:hypothetical protein
MADLNPPPLFSPTNKENEVADVGEVIITHGEVPCPAVELVIVLVLMTVRRPRP